MTRNISTKRPAASGSLWDRRSPETETIYNQFHAGRDNSKERVTRLAQRLDELAPVNRAMALGRVPLLTARIIRALDKLGLIGTAVDVVGTNALFVYERLAGVHITSGLLSTQDVDLLMDSRFSLRLIAKDFSNKGSDRPSAENRPFLRASGQEQLPGSEPRRFSC